MSDIFDIFLKIAPYAIAYTIPLMIATLGGLYSERSGVVNIGIEGLLIVGTFASALTIKYLQPMIGDAALWLGLLAGLLAGMLFSALHAFASINLKANQVISGTAINMVASALCMFLSRNVTGSGNITITSGFMKRDIPLLSKIPIIGNIFFTRTYYTTWLALALLLFSWYVLYKTPFGMHFRACGENPQAADAAGINVYRIRYIGVLLSGACAGLGGGIIIVTYAGEFNGTVAGLGFLALAALIFGKWRPLGILLSTLFFGFASTISNVSQAIPELQKIPSIYLKTFPYVVTLIALILFSKTTQGPRAAGEIYDKGKR